MGIADMGGIRTIDAAARSPRAAGAAAGLAADVAVSRAIRWRGAGHGGCVTAAGGPGLMRAVGARTMRPSPQLPSADDAFR